MDTVAEDAAAIAISAGGATKTYAHTDPNEDCAMFALGKGGWLAAVADGHRGFEASEVALEHLGTHPAPQWTEIGGVTPDSWSRHALAVLCDATAHSLTERGTEPGASRTTLALALVSPETGALLYASIGDSHIFEVREEGARDLARSLQGTFFLGHGDETVETLAPRCAIGCVPLAGLRAVVLATDGLSEQQIGVRNPARAVSEAIAQGAAAAPGLRPREAARTLVDTAMAAQRGHRSGDNIATAILWLGPTSA